LFPGESSVDGASGGQLPACSIRCRHGHRSPKRAMSALGQKPTFGAWNRCPLLPRKRTWRGQSVMSALCHSRPKCSAARSCY
jgi:hypothetical protein